MFVLISTFSKTFDEVWLIYEIPKFLIKEFKLWQIAQITIKDNIELWVILNEIDINSTNIDISKIKSIIGIKNSDIFVNSYRNELISWIASYYITPIHNSTNLFFPKNLKEKIINWKIPSLTKIIEDTKYTYTHNISLSNEQTKAHNDIINSKNNKILFYWLTWSWKTEIYIKLIQENIKNNKQSLFLIPEIILTNQLSSKIKNVFWDANPLTLLAKSALNAR